MRKRTTNKLQEVYTTTVHQLSLQIWSELQFISFALLPHISFFIPRVQHTAAWFPSTCVMETFPPWLGVPSRFHYNTTYTSSLYLDGVRGSAAAIWGSTQIHNTVSYVATYQHQPHLFNSDLESEVSSWVEVLMIPSPSHWIHWTKETTETNSPLRDTWIITDKAPPPEVLLPWIISLCKGLDQLVNLSTAALN